MDSPPRECEVEFSAIRATFSLSLPLQSLYPTLEPAPQIFEGRCPHTTLTLLILPILPIHHTQGDITALPTGLPQPSCSPTTPTVPRPTHPPPHTVTTQMVATPQQPTTRAALQRGHTSASMASWLGPTRFEATG